LSHIGTPGVTTRLVDVTERGDQAWAAPDRPSAGAGPPSYASDWPEVPPGRPSLPAPPVRRPAPLRITLPPHIAPPPPPPPPPPARECWPGGTVRGPGGLIPAGPPRPIYREPGPVRFGPVLAGAGAAGLWMLLFGLLASTPRGYAWLTFSAGTLAWLGALA